MGVRKGARVSEEMNRVCSSLPLFLMLLGQLLGARSGRGGEGASEHERVMRAAGTPRSRSQRALTACGLEQRAQQQQAGRAERERQAERGEQPGGEGVVGAGAAGLGELIHSSLSAI